MMHGQKNIKFILSSLHDMS